MFKQFRLEVASLVESLVNLIKLNLWWKGSLKFRSVCFWIVFYSSFCLSFRVFVFWMFLDCFFCAVDYSSVCLIDACSLYNKNNKNGIYDIYLSQNQTSKQKHQRSAKKYCFGKFGRATHWAQQKPTATAQPFKCYQVDSLLFDANFDWRFHMPLDISLEINNNKKTQMDLEIHLEAGASDHQLKKMCLKKACPYST